MADVIQAWASLNLVALVWLVMYVEITRLRRGAFMEYLAAKRRELGDDDA